MKSMVRLSVILLKEASDLTGISTARDQEELIARTEKEGLSFLTITLPNFEKQLLAAVEAGMIGPDAFPGWEKDASGTPKFLGGFLSRIFSNGVDRVRAHDPQPGELWLSHLANYDRAITATDFVEHRDADDQERHREEVSYKLSICEPWFIDYVQAIRMVRQITLLHSKVEMECKPCRIEETYSKYKATDKEIRDIPLVTLAGLPVEPTGSTRHICDRWKD